MHHQLRRWPLQQTCGGVDAIHDLRNHPQGIRARGTTHISNAHLLRPTRAQNLNNGFLPQCLCTRDNCVLQSKKRKKEIVIFSAQHLEFSSFLQKLRYDVRRI
ncbi:hypothetical protein V8G54_035694 [Vigna mungo]|uniref:Uncharacterized protein n=1 Tax=Vigna mungo TaxID=3915 RepID=A0AAQ3MFJ7_VIGMU